MFTERTREILEASVRDFIKTGKPVTSERLYAEYDFGIKPAMIRWELNNLTKKGYLCQNHPSSGRTPSDKAYGSFVGAIMNELEDVRAEVRNPWEAVFEDEKHKFVQMVSETLRVLSVWYEAEDDDLYSSGLGELVEKLELAGRAELVDLLKDVENIADVLASQKSWWRKETEWPRVFIGRNPITKNRNVSVVAERITDPKNGACLMIAVGSKRMNYEKSIKLCKSVRALVE